ncbi:GABA-gated chloride channel 1 subunit-like protein [Dinothrombium tinctorium]|uniref:GABA-gated chloride channel 1 subunit-like protein n=1 Tax=Dinothrombium tinctorium TaxID=1965070 RepID=A0A443R7T2_9ACAR|nr:GABA-gated chloride channel 1 subunit-like protein [Dinothrombium tinctorium]
MHPTVIAKVEENTQDYEDSKAMPNEGSDKIMMINVFLHIDYINSLSDQDMDFSVDFNMKLNWRFSNLSCQAFKNKLTVNRVPVGPHGIEVTDKSTVWMPNIFLMNAKSEGTQTKETRTEFLLYKQDADKCEMTYNARFTSVVSCPLTFQHYPVDIQHCQIKFRSCKYNHFVTYLKASYVKHDIERFYLC